MEVPTGIDNDGQPIGGYCHRLVCRILLWVYAYVVANDPRNVLSEVRVEIGENHTGSIVSYSTTRRASEIATQAVVWFLWLVVIFGTLFVIKNIENASGFGNSNVSNEAHRDRPQIKDNGCYLVVDRYEGVVLDPVRYPGN